jgi:serine/threonine protein kinase, bacterial
MAEVYLAQHPRLPRRDALKILSEAITADSAYRERVSARSRPGRRAVAPDVVAVHDRGEFDG